MTTLHEQTMPIIRAYGRSIAILNPIKNDMAKKILKTISDNPEITGFQISLATDIGVFYVYKVLKDLLRAGVVNRVVVKKEKFYTVNPDRIVQINRICAELANGVTI